MNDCCCRCVQSYSVCPPSAWYDITKLGNSVRSTRIISYFIGNPPNSMGGPYPRNDQKTLTLRRKPNNLTLRRNHEKFTDHHAGNPCHAGICPKHGSHHGLELMEHLPRAYLRQAHRASGRLHGEHRTESRGLYLYQYRRRLSGRTRGRRPTENKPAPLSARPETGGRLYPRQGA